MDGVDDFFPTVQKGIGFLFEVAPHNRPNTEHRTPNTEHTEHRTPNVQRPT
jgi:hypothetical protein